MYYVIANHLNCDFFYCKKKDSWSYLTRWMIQQESRNCTIYSSRCGWFYFYKKRWLTKKRRDFRFGNCVFSSWVCLSLWGRAIAFLTVFFLIRNNLKQMDFNLMSHETHKHIYASRGRTLEFCVHFLFCFVFVQFIYDVTLLCIANFARHIIFIDGRLLQEHVQTSFVLGKWMTGYFIDKTFKALASLFDEILVE